MKIKKEYLVDKDGNKFYPILPLSSIKLPERFGISYDEIENSLNFMFYTEMHDLYSVVSLKPNGEIVCYKAIEGEEEPIDYEAMAKNLAEMFWVASGMSLSGTYTYVDEEISEYEFHISIRDENTTVMLVYYYVNAKDNEVIEE